MLSGQSNAALMGLALSSLGVGGWLGLLNAPWAEQEAAAVEAVQRAVSLGVNYLDTAPMYGYGEAERHLGLGLKALGAAARAQVYVSTKVGWHPDRQHRCDADSVRWLLEGSLKALHSDSVDIVQIHHTLSDAQAIGGYPLCISMI